MNFRKKNKKGPDKGAKALLDLRYNKTI